MTFQDGRHSILSLVLSFITLFSFQGAIFKLKIENGKLKVNFPFQSYLNDFNFV